MNRDNIPQEIQNRPQWVCHNVKKIPFQPNGQPAKSNDPVTWSPFKDALKAVGKDTSGAYTGIGYMFSENDPYVGIDLDGCLINGQLVPQAQQIVNFCNSYTEISPSGTGLHIFVKGNLPPGIPHKIAMDDQGYKAFEIYARQRYFTVTGEVFGEIKPIRSVDIAKLPVELPSTPNGSPVHIGEQDLLPLIELIKKGNEGQAFTALHEHGDLSTYIGDQSRADLAYIGIVSKWTNFDVKLTDRLFRASALMRPKWDKAHRSDGSTYGQMTIQKVLDNKGIYNKREHEGYLSYHHKFRYNVVLGRTEILHDGDWQKINDYQLNSIHRDMENKGATISVQKLTGLLQSDFVPPFHPFREYFSSLPAWDGTDWVAQLADQVQTTDQPYWIKCLRKWIVAMIASAIKDDIVNHTVLIFVGKQGVGKSTFFLNLIPAALREYIYSGALNPTDKDSLIHLSECILVNLDELETLTKYKETALKEIITKSEIRIRRPYGRFSEKMPRHASLCGSVNEQSVLNDPSGSRRFLVHKVNSLNYQHQVNMEQVFAQALHLFKTGFTYWFTPQEIQQVHVHNREFEMQSVEEELLLRNYEPVTSTDSAAKRYTATELLEQVRPEGTRQSINHSSKIRMGQALAKHDFEHVRSGGITYWFVKSVASALFQNPGPDQEIS